MNDIEFLIAGAGILGTGGGGDPIEAMVYAKSLQSMPAIVQLEKLDPDAIVCTAFMVGSSASFEKGSSTALLAAKAAFEGLVKSKVSGIIPVEIGPGAISEAIKASVMFGVPLVDADIVGKRSAPEVYLETTTLAGIAREPLAVANNGGDVKIIESANGYKETESILRSFAIKSGGCAYVIGYPMKVSLIRGVVGEGTVSLAILLGKCLGKPDPIGEVCNLTGGSVLFSGTVNEVKKEGRGGFLVGEALIVDGKSEARVWFKNENLMLWVDGKLKACAPDLICMLNTKNVYGTYNRDLAKGNQVTVVGIPALPIWRTKKGKELFGPRAFGFEEDYVDFKVSL